MEEAKKNGKLNKKIKDEGERYVCVYGNKMRRNGNGALEEEK